MQSLGVSSQVREITQQCHHIVESWCCFRMGVLVLAYYSHWSYSLEGSCLQRASTHRSTGSHFDTSSANLFLRMAALILTAARAS